MIRAVLDTSILIRAVLRPLGSVGFVLREIGQGRFVTLYSEDLLAELAEVLGRQRFRVKYGIEDADVQTVIATFLRHGEAVDPQQSIAVCRDPKDDKFLEVAVEGKADAIVTGDEDLLVLDPFQGIAIMGPSAFRALLAQSS